MSENKRNIFLELTLKINSLKMFQFIWNSDIMLNMD